ncbi:phosphotransferase-like protein [Burkholderia lata]|uniref:phosphotransferase-like protein n=1 Tax=Burkholderia lata (strain ATCC 17760 / DSM 23089 / LMG 22485 / NCIMB 9086 / R18194 / 383) TaxID=482957 RepID=UPI001583C090
MPELRHGAIVVLNGPSSAGKSTLSRYLCENLDEHHLHVELDVFRNMEPPNYWAVEKSLAQIRMTRSVSSDQRYRGHLFQARPGSDCRSCPVA